jgi:drug/metabolite transporter (DMT)-like permease
VKLSKAAQADLALIFITFVWGSTFTVVKKSLDQASPIFFVALRFWIAASVTTACMPRRILGLSRRSLRRGLLLAATLAAGFIFQTLGLRFTSPSYSAFITSLSVLLVPLLGLLIFRRRPGMRTAAGVALATLGLFLLLVRASAVKAGAGEILTLVCAFMFAFQILLLGRFVSTTDYRDLLWLQIAGTAVLSTLAALLLEDPFIVWDSSLALYLFITAVLATSLALYVQAWAQKFTTANRAALIFSLEPFFAAVFAYWILGQVLTAREWAGGALVIAGILVSEIRRPSVSED